MIEAQQILHTVSEEMWAILHDLERTIGRPRSETPPHMCTLNINAVPETRDAFIVSHTAIEDIRVDDPAAWPAFFAYRASQSDSPGVAYSFLGLIMEQDGSEDTYVTLLFSHEGRAVCGFIQDLQTLQYDPTPLDDLDIAFPFSLYQNHFDGSKPH